MTKLDKLGKREKNRFLRELEQYEKDKIDAATQSYYDDDEDYAREYWQDVKDGLFDYDAYYNDYYDDYADYLDYDLRDYAEDYDDFDHYDALDDEKKYASLLKPGTHVKNCRDYYIVSASRKFVNLRTGEECYYINGNVEVVLDVHDND